jgi:hypothetical protein
LGCGKTTTKESKMKSDGQIIKDCVKSLYMQEASKRKGWSNQDAAHVVLAFVASKAKVSLFDFVENYVAA